MFATLFDGITHHYPEGLWFCHQAQVEGLKSAAQWHDSGRNIPEADDARADPPTGGAAARAGFPPIALISMRFRR